MTIEEWASDKLVNHGLFPDDAKAVIAQAKVDPILESFRERWADAVSGYDSVLLSVFWFSLSQIALQWIDENCPQAWFRSLFVPEQSERQRVADSKRFTKPC